MENRGEDFAYRILIWFNKKARKVLVETKQRFILDLHKHIIATASKDIHDELDMKNEKRRSLAGSCYFFGGFKVELKSEMVNEKWMQFEEETRLKGDKRDTLIRNLITITLVSLSFIVAGVQSLSLTDNKKIFLSVMLAILGVLFVRSMKNRILETRASSYKYHLYKIYLELRYSDFIVPLTIRNRDQRGYTHIPTEDRDIALTKQSSTDDELVIISIAKYLYIGSVILSLIMIKGIPLIDFEFFGYCL